MADYHYLLSPENSGYSPRINGITSSRKDVAKINKLRSLQSHASIMIAGALLTNCNEVVDGHKIFIKDK